MLQDQVITKRSDIHRPSVIVPDDYQFIGLEYQGPFTAELTLIDRAIIREHMTRTGGTYSRHEHGGNCHVCGAHALYTAIFYHVPSNVYVRTGMDCADKLGYGGDGEQFRKIVRNALDAIAGKRKAEAFLASVDLVRAWAIYTDNLRTEAARLPWAVVTLCDIVGKLVRYGSISDKQVAFVRKLVSQIDAPAAAPAASTSKHLGTVGVRQDWTATVTFKASYDSAFGTVLITGLVDDSGNVLIVKGSTPFAADKGARVTFRATVKAHNVREGVAQTIVNRAKLAR